MRLPSVFKRRPSAAIIISCAALFMSLGGASYAAVSIPRNSVGQAQLKNNSVSFKKIVPEAVGNKRLANNGVSNSKLANNSVSYKKIRPRAVGTVRANLDQLQARLKTTCAAGSAVGAVDNKGNVTCNATPPAEYGTQSASAAVTANPADVTTLSLPAGPAGYLAFANPTVTATSSGSPQTVSVTCSLGVGNTVQSRTVSLHTDSTSGDDASASIPLQLATGAGGAAVSCHASVKTGTLPKTTAVAQINALQTSANN